MVRNYRRHTRQTSPEGAGKENMSEKVLEKAEDVEMDELMSNLVPLFEKGVQERKQRPRGTNWTPEEMEKSVTEYFRYFGEKGLKPSKSSLRVWLGCSTSQYHAWYSDPNRYGAISEIIQLANDIMETQYINRGEKHPQMNVFLLKTSHAHVEKQEVEINSKDNEISKDEIDSALERLGLNKGTEKTE